VVDAALFFDVGRTSISCLRPRGPGGTSFVQGGWMREPPGMEEAVRAAVAVVPFVIGKFRDVCPSEPAFRHWSPASFHVEPK